MLHRTRVACPRLVAGGSAVARWSLPRPSVRARSSAIPDNFKTLAEVQTALRQNGLESSSLIVAVGEKSFDGQSLHKMGSGPNPYEEAISIVAKTLEAFDDDGLIPAFGFGDATTHDTAVFSFFPDGAPAKGLQALVSRYRELAPKVRLAGPTSFAPAIYQAMKIVVDSGNQYHILVIVADGQVTRSLDTLKGQNSAQEQATIDAIVAASKLPLSILMVGVGDGPWDMMAEFDDNLPARKFDNFQFVDYTDIASRLGFSPQRKEAAFAIGALQEIPEQFKLVQTLKLLGSSASFKTSVKCLQPPA